ncbi:hypothetical protein [Candidatus Poriferisocius sp.]|uniref:hypothetical protein n=1 Tax=Candidatus Poriferisocius sp. TaxID=3101276 RepID=UPI003B58D353
MDLKPGSRLKSSVCETELIVVKAPSGDVDIRCGGAPMGDPANVETNGEVAGDAAGGTALGKRYVNDDESLEVLCTKPGAGSLAVDGTPLGLKEAKPLPASD